MGLSLVLAKESLPLERCQGLPLRAQWRVHRTILTTNPSINSVATPKSLYPRVSDPTRTLMLRRDFSGQMTVRYSKLRKSILTYMRALPSNTYLSYAGPATGSSRRSSTQPSRLSSLVSNQYGYITSINYDNFLIWLSNETDSTILSTSWATTAWTNKYIEAAYNRGLSFASTETRKKSGNSLLPLLAVSMFLLPSRDGIPTERLFLKNRFTYLSNLAFNNLRNINKEMLSQISNILSDAIARNYTIAETTRLLLDRVDKIGLTRARLLARTSIPEIYNSGSIDSYRIFSRMLDRRILGEYLTANDSLVRTRHRARHKKLYELDIIRLLFGEANCRCGFSPYIVEPGEEVPESRFGPINRP